MTRRLIDFLLLLVAPIAEALEIGGRPMTQNNDICRSRRDTLSVTRLLVCPMAPLLILPETAWGDTGGDKTTKGNKIFNDTDNENTIHKLKIVADPKTYSALSYAPPNNNEKTPLILVLHGAGRNDLDIRQDLGNPSGEHAGLIPSLMESGKAPSNLLQNFAVLAPYSRGKPSFYSDSRSQLLDFCDWANRNQNTKQLPIQFDPNRIILFGFSDGATVAVELLTTRRFAAGVVCSYGYSGKSLPPAALDRLVNVPMWVFHSQDDVIFDVQNSDRLVQQLQTVNQKNNGRSDIIQYSRYNKDPEELPPRVRGHSMGITASKSPEVYDWMMEATKSSSPQTQ